ncbi:MAG: endolytic transglycosylase MltG [Porticoccaceae bacterium]
MFYRLSAGLLIIVVVAFSLLASVKSWLDIHLEQPLRIEGKNNLIHVAPGSSLSLLSRQLSAEGFIHTPYPLLIYGRLEAMDQIKAGDYEVVEGQSLRRFLERLVAGDVIRFRITFPEGRSLKEWLQIINSHEKLAAQDQIGLDQVEARFSAPTGESLEGWFFPDTYTFTSSDDAINILSQAHRNMVAVLAEEWRGRSDNLPIETPYEALILASIIEKETGVPQERGAIAGVFVRRLEKGMKLQTDPTVIYGLGGDYSGNLTRAHLRALTPYNTYQVSGLPPTPITNPGREAIHAALHPQPGTALFFVARGDGSHQFSDTLAEHQRAVREYQLRRVKDYRSAPKVDGSRNER